MLRLVVFDMDGTLVDVESSWGAVHDFYGVSNKESVRLFMEDRIDDLEFTRRDVAIWKTRRPDIAVDDLEAIFDEVPLMPGAEALFATIHREGIMTAIVSGGIDLLARRVARELGIDYVLANGLRVDASGRLTGEGIIRVPIKQKERILANLQTQLGISLDVTAAVGNSEIDVGLFRRSRIGVAFLPQDEEVRLAATAVVTEKDLARVADHLFPSEEVAVPGAKP